MLVGRAQFRGGLPIPVKTNLPTKWEKVGIPSGTLLEQNASTASLHTQSHTRPPDLSHIRLTPSPTQPSLLLQRAITPQDDWMTNSEDKKHYKDLIESVRDKRERLPSDSHLKAALPVTKIDELSREIEADTLQNLTYRNWPPIVIFIDRHNLSDIFELEGDLNSVILHSNGKQMPEITQFLKADSNDVALWCAGLFEVFAKSTLLKRVGPSAVTFDTPLPSGRNTDIRLELNEKPLYLECTVITDSDEDRGTWDRFLEAKKVDPEVMLVRPGPFSPPNAKSPSPYYNCLRFYAKTYDKLAKDLNPLRCQCSEDSPNILLISFNYWAGHMAPTDVGVGWALDELFADQPLSRLRLKDVTPGITDISLLGWLDFMANELITQSRLASESYSMNLNKLLAAPRKLGGAMLFDDCSLKAARRNYNARKECQLPHRDLAELETLLGTSPIWRPPAWIG